MKVKSFFYSTMFAVIGVCSFQPSLAAGSSENSFKVTNLVSDLPDVAPTLDPNLINPWGLTFEDGNLVVADNGTSLATSYTPDGTIVSFVINVESDPSGLEKNPSKKAFQFTESSLTHAAKYLFASEDGTILAFSKHVDPNNAVVVVDRSSFGAVYKGLAIAKVHDEYLLFATDFHNGQIDTFNSDFNYLYSFTDPSIPTGFAPFNIQYFDKKLYVTYAKQKAPDNHDDQAGPGNGFVDIFNTDGSLDKRLISRGELNSPWGLAIAPKHFGDFKGKLLVGNFGNGIINVYNRKSGKFEGQLKDKEGGVLSLAGLWAIKFDDSTTLYFTSGPDGESDGLVGKITPSKCHHSSSSSD